MRHGIIIGLAAIFCGTVATGKRAEPPVLAPSTVWNMDYDKEACRLQRGFGDGDERVIVRFVKYGPTDDLEILASGRQLAAIDNHDLTYAFDPGGELRTVEHALFGKSADGVTTWQFGATFLPRENDDDPGPDPEAEHARLYKARLKAIRSLRLTNGIAHPVAVELGTMVKPMEAMAKCLDDLVRTWGLDPAIQDNLRSRPRPKSKPARWITSGDYPLGLVANGISGRIPFRLMIDAEGNTTACKIQALYTDPRFESAVCPVLQRRARFDPAIGPDGQPVASVWLTSVTFLSHK